MKQFILVSMLFILIALTSIIVHIPANTAIEFIQNFIPIKVDGLKGTIWKGSAEKLSWRNQNLESVDWNFQIRKLFLAKMEILIRFGKKNNSKSNIYGEGYLGYGLFGPYITKISAHFSSNQLTKQLKLPRLFKINGNFDLSIDEIYYLPPYCQQAKGQLIWNLATITSPFGDLDLEKMIIILNCQDNIISISGHQKSNQVTSEFSAHLNKEKYIVNILFEPKNKFPKELKKYLQWLPKNNKNHYQLSYQGNLLMSDLLKDKLLII
ncbi:general secretion pathway protein N [Candidatus Photodesmus katoptron]|uniref:Type II secretion system protein N n=1 Tax=Candidatus Photodesmus katoptron Akat1 TaxID=1236703 RepID=S3DZZ3_9GAMM|nr:type II secretion system protein N [Candidatus Photodesmus katoptron]EPE37536.1 bacterial type II secretion system protein N [Candidatus Photodesmus katoptron Akat1]KEY90186.1 general secretion pathway protein N [Candidatus Photodesmus katoptron]